MSTDASDEIKKRKPETKDDEGERTAKRETTTPGVTIRKGVTPPDDVVYGYSVPKLAVGNLLTFCGTTPNDLSIGLEIVSVHQNKQGQVISAVGRNHRLGDFDLFVTRRGYWALAMAKKSMWCDIVPRPFAEIDCYVDDGVSDVNQVQRFMRCTIGGICGPWLPKKVKQ